METRFTDDGIGSGAELVRWDELTSVAIRTTSDGPFAEDVFWQFLTPTRFFELPGMFVRGDDLGSMQKHLEGMDHDSVIRAMCSTDERVFAVWSRGIASVDTLGERFEALVERLSGHRAKGAFEKLRAAWTTPERRYHTLAHLRDCLAVLDSTKSPAALADTAELALFYHDAVYVPAAKDNEEMSAAMLVADAATLRLPNDVAKNACDCILKTKHIPTQPSEVSDLVNDCDLAVLGSDPLRFLDYEHGIRDEFANIPWWKFIIARGRILESFQRREPLYRTPALSERFEALAKRNIASLIRSPRYRLYRWVKTLHLAGAAPAHRSVYAAKR